MAYDNPTNIGLESNPLGPPLTVDEERSAQREAQSIQRMKIDYAIAMDRILAKTKSNIEIHAVYFGVAMDLPQTLATKHQYIRAKLWTVRTRYAQAKHMLSYSSKFARHLVPQYLRECSVIRTDLRWAIWEAEEVLGRKHRRQK